MYPLSRRASLLGALSTLVAAAASGRSSAGAGRSPAHANPQPRGLSFPRELELLAWNLDLRAVVTPEPLARVDRAIALLAPFDLLALSGLHHRQARARLLREIATSHAHLALGRLTGRGELVAKVVRAGSSGQITQSEIAEHSRHSPAGGLVIATRHPMHDDAALWSPAENRRTWIRDAALHVRLAIEAAPGEHGTTSLDLFAVHLSTDPPHHDRHQCERRLDELGEFVATHTGTSESALVVGTIACAQTCYPRLLAALPGFADLWETVGPAERGATYDGSRNLLVAQSDRVARVDYALFRPGPASEAVAVDIPAFD